MTYAHFERLSPMDLTFLAMEDGRAHMHIGSVNIFEAEPLRREDGGIDFDRLLAFIDAQLYKVPRLRQKLEWVPGFGQPVWVDDAHFNLRFHVRHTALPPPGDLRQLKRLAGRILSQEFDRGKPMWEDWFVDGLEGNRFALISKVHHCMADGISGVALAKVLVGPDPAYKPPSSKEWIPRPAPSATQLVLEELRHRVSAPFSLLAGAWGERERSGGPRRVEAPGLRALLDNVRDAIGSGSRTPLGVEIGPHRRFDFTQMPFAEVRSIGAIAGGTLNDVVLAIATGALRSFLRRRGVSVSGLDLRAAVPVSVRTQEERDALGNRISGMLARLPVDEPDPWRRLVRVVETTHELKTSGQSGIGEVLTQVMDLLPPALLGMLFRRAARSSVADVAITNVPGPRFPVYLLGARQIATYPVVPLAPNQALGIALMSYDQDLFWGFNSDWDAVPDLHDLVDDVEVGFQELLALAPSRKPAEQDAAPPGPEAGA
jgi:WS/DGAT/MGAT family acyltransferase